MTREQIEKEAREYSDVIWNNDRARDISKIAFSSGALWRINSVWHEGNVSCNTRRKALVTFKNGNAAVYNDLRELTYERLWGEVERFAYLDDLLPDGKEETK